MTTETTETAEALYATGHWLLENDRTRDAALVFQAMALTSQKDERAWLGLGACHERSGQLGIAAEVYRVGIEAAAPAVRCRIARGRVLRALGLHELAEEAFASARDAALASTSPDHGPLAVVAEDERSAS